MTQGVEVIPQTRTVPQDVFDILETYMQENLRVESKLADHFAVRHVSSCPRQLWFRAREFPYSNPPRLGQWITMRWGEDAESAEFDALAVIPPQRMGNSTDLVSAMPQFPTLAQAYTAAQEMWQWKRVQVAPNVIRGLPLRTSVEGVKRPLHGVVDMILLLRDSPRILEVKQTRGRGATKLRSNNRPYTSWVLQLYLYCRALDLPGELHVWGRDTGYYTKFPLTIQGDDVLLSGEPFLVPTNQGNLHPLEFVARRLQYVERVIDLEAPPGRARITNNQIIEPVFEECSMPEDEIYRLTITRTGMVGNPVSIKGQKFESRRCDSCWDRDNCMQNVVSRALEGLGLSPNLIAAEAEEESGAEEEGNG